MKPEERCPPPFPASPPPAPAPDPVSRRHLIAAGLGAFAVTSLAGCGGQAQAASPPPAATGAATTAPAASGAATPPAFAGAHVPVPLPFAPTSLRGLSERLITSHHQNNYTGAVKNLNRAEKELAAVTKETPPFVVAGLRLAELRFRNSKSLHEAYFANLGGDGRRSGPIEAAITRAYGSAAVWEEHFRASALGLGGGSGWVVLALELDTSSLRTVSLSDHTQSIAQGAPLLVLDMYEHAHQMDFGASVPPYIDAFIANIRWDEVNSRLARAERAAAALRG